jgi:chromosome segregation ATPase
MWIDAAYAPPGVNTLSTEIHRPMPNEMTNTCRYASSYALAALLLCGCDADVERANTPSKSVNAKVTEQHPEAQADEAKRLARMSELDANLTATQSQHDQFKLQQTRLIAQIDAHQTDSAANLARLKTELATKQARAAENKTPATDLDQFNDAARNQLEQALALDQEYISQLNAINSELQQLGDQMDAMRKELASLKIKQGLSAAITDAADNHSK